MFWDGRVAQEADYFGSPAADLLPEGLAQHAGRAGDVPRDLA